MIRTFLVRILEVIFLDNNMTQEPEELLQGDNKLCIARKIEYLDIKENVLCITFPHDSVLLIYDDKQDCCERRSISTDDDLNYFADSILISIQICDGYRTEVEDVHDIQFLKVNTSKGMITFENHNEHSGCYTGFNVIAKLKTK